MHEMRALSDAELVATAGDIVPRRDTLALVNIANIVSVNVAIALNAATINSTATATAGQLIAAAQF
ncbi:MAG TPA: hypothetical protein VF015_08140 [Acidimicrobiales bacterium]